MAQPGSLMPVPTALPTDDLSALFAIMAKNRQLGMQHSVKDIRNTQAARRRAFQRAKAALAKALKAKKKGGFWRKLAGKCLKIAKIAVVAAAIATAVGTGGAAAPVVILAWSAAGMSTAAFIQGETHYLQKMGMSDKAAGWTEFGLTVGAGAAGGVATFCSESSLATGFSKAAEATALGAGVAGGVATWQASKYEAEELDHRADAVAAKGAEQMLERMIAMMLSDLEHSEKSDERTLDHLKGAIEAKGEALVLAGKKV